MNNARKYRPIIKQENAMTQPNNDSFESAMHAKHCELLGIDSDCSIEEAWRIHDTLPLEQQLEIYYGLGALLTQQIERGAVVVTRMHYTNE